jgi:hypothetical protein
LCPRRGTSSACGAEPHRCVDTSQCGSVAECVGSWGVAGQWPSSACGAGQHRRVICGSQKCFRDAASTHAAFDFVQWTARDRPPL